jgi:hypothetical protein
MASYPHLDNLIGAYFNQDAGHIADTLEEIVADYMDGHGADKQAALRRDISAFMADHRAGLDVAFDDKYGFDVDPKLWDCLDAEAFLSAVDAVLAGNGPASGAG